MDIWITRSRKKATCSRCKQGIPAQTPLVKGKLWKHQGKVFSRPLVFRWHIQCWIDAGLEYLKQHPIVEPIHNRGGRIELSEEDKKARVALLMRRARLNQRCKQLVELMSDGSTNELNIKLVSVHAKMDALMPEIEKVGGVPKSWLR